MLSMATSHRPAPDAVRYAIPLALTELDAARHHVVEASAGTGKTYLIEHRVVDLLLTTDTLLEQILVVTFTEKATAELRFRIRRLLETVLGARDHSAAEDQPHWLIDHGARGRLGDALLSFDRAAIYTIHSFCQRMLTENAFANRRLFAQTQVAGEEAFADAFKAALREELACSERYRPYLAAWLWAGRDVEGLEKLLYSCANQRGRLVPEYEPEAVIRCMDRAVLALGRFADDAAITTALRGFKVHASSVRAAESRLAMLRAMCTRWGEHRDPAMVLAELDRGKNKNDRILPYLLQTIGKAKLSPGDCDMLELRDAIADMADTLVPLPAAVAQLFLPAVTRRMDEEKSRRGHFDFHDMLGLVWDSMDGAGGVEVIERLRSRFLYALIDEFQDTDELQWKIFRQIYIESGGTNTLCIIGDPKQAIYSFRGADVYTYLEARRDVSEHGGHVTNLVDNYRSTDLLIRAYNLIFEERSGQGFFTGDIRYDHPVRAATELEARDGAGAPIVPICLLQVTPPEQPRPGKLHAEPMRQALLDRITAEIKRLLHGEDERAQLYVGKPGELSPIAAGDIFVLTRNKRESNDVATELRQAGVPCAIYKQEGLFQTREAQEVHDLLAGVAEPRHRSARFRAWNTRFFGLSLSDLPYLSDLPETHPLLARLYEWRAMAEKLAYEELFARIIDESGIIERELFLDTSERALTNFLHLFELLLEEVMRSRCELHELVQRLSRWIRDTADAPGDERNVQRLEGERSAVQIMTIHRSKGLEAKVVFIYGGFNASHGDDVQVYHDGGERLVHVGYAGHEVASAVGRESESEDQRLLYVALTRAMARLYLPYVAAGDYKMTGCYGQLVRRLAPIAEALAAGDQELARLFVIERAAAGRGAGGRSRRTAIDDWEPPAALLGGASAPAAPVAYDEIRAARAGFVVTSYTRMKSRGASNVPLAAVDFKADIAAAGARLPDDALPGGAQSGVFLHSLLEHVPFASLHDTDFETWRRLPEIERLFRHAMLRHNRDPQHLYYSQQVVYNSLTTPIALGKKILPGLAWCERSMREVEFVYPIPTSLQMRVALGLALGFALGFDRGLGAEPPAEHDSVRLERGYIKGIIDLGFEYQGRVFLVDWKSDILPDYSGKTMARHVSHEYPVQAELYTLALAKMLEITTPAQHQRRFGGLLYCFVRGMGQAREADRRQPGVYYIRPSFDSLAELEAALQQRSDYQ